MNKETVSTIIFRFDGVLLDVNFMQTWRNVAKHLNVSGRHVDAFMCFLAGAVVELPIILDSQKVTNESIEEKIDMILGEFLADHHVTAKQVTEALKLSELYDCRPVEGALDTVMYLYQKGYKLVSQGDVFGMVQMELLRKFGFLKYFEKVCGPIGSCYKPNPASMYPILRGNDPSHFLFVSNSPGVDLLMAENLGIHTVWFKSCLRKELFNLVDFHPERTINAPLELQNLL